MINQIILVGRLTGDPEIEEYENGKKRTIINIAVQRQFKNIDNKYDTDFFRCVLWNGMASNTKNYCQRGDIVGVKGRVQNRNYVDSENNTRYITEIIAEKISFVSHSQKKENNSDEKEEYENVIENF
ncbi:single-stranded DNA-binding protein [Firmicutes bacterium CAG:460]|jgi:single-strand DNA-binding protein|uniref:single-stranded DNA-binding protein n=1 Tax=Candidatus Onthocola sp. TaxID=3085646 RepID=UPI00033C9177|nr:single-stranded DNA-binding protein [Firmicutes bacterium CAG:460]